MTHGARARIIYYLLLGAIILVLAGGALWMILDKQARIEHLLTVSDRQASQIQAKDAQIESLTDDLIASQQNAQQLYDQILALGQAPDGQNPATVPGPQGDTGARGPAGAAGADGATPTPQDIVDAVQGYCVLNNGCRGPAGANGTNGVNGTNGSDGAAGANGADGAPGAPGPAGPTCPDGYVLQTSWVSSDPLIFVPAQALSCQPTAG